MLRRLWTDEGGAILSVELILILVMLVFGLVVGFKALRDAIDGKLVDLANAVQNIDTGYGWGGILYTSNVYAFAGTQQDQAWVAGSTWGDGDVATAGQASFTYEVLTSEAVAPDTAATIISAVTPAGP